MTITGENVGKITADSKQLGEHIQVIDNAMKDVEVSNHQLVDNMEQVSSIVKDMNNCISDSSETSKRMTSKYAETSENINEIEEVIEALMCELGIGGFMGVEDLLPGMKVIFHINTGSGDAEYHGELVKQLDTGIVVSSGQLPVFKKAVTCSVNVTVGNVLYCWGNVELTSNDNGNVSIRLNSRPKIANRRKYPRLDVNYSCKITDRKTGQSYDGTIDNISANGFAFASKEPFFADCKGTDVSVEIENFVLSAHNVLDGKIIRSTNDDGTYLVGCQMPEDNIYIMEYVESQLRG